MSYNVVNEEFLQRIELLQTLVKNNVAGMFGGDRKSKSFGSSCEFADYREYAPGDDTTKIDWNAYGRFEKLYTKLYLDERQMHTRIYVDASRSMGFGKQGKDEQSLKIAAALAYISVCEMDKVSIYSIDGSGLNRLIGGMLGKESFINSIGALNDVVFSGGSRIGDAVIPSTVGYGDGLSVIISDFLCEGEYENVIDYLVSKKRHVLCIQVLSAEELNPKARGKMHFFDSEDMQRSYRKNITKDIVNAYRQAVRYCTETIRNYCSTRGADYVLVGADEPLENLFFGKMQAGGIIK